MATLDRTNKITYLGVLPFPLISSYILVKYWSSVCIYGAEHQPNCSIHTSPSVCVFVLFLVCRVLDDMPIKLTRHVEELKGRFFFVIDLFLLATQRILLYL